MGFGEIKNISAPSHKPPEKAINVGDKPDDSPKELLSGRRQGDAEGSTGENKDGNNLPPFVKLTISDQAKKAQQERLARQKEEEEARKRRLEGNK